MINNIDEEKFWLLIKDGFAHKRKILAGNLKNYIKDEKISDKFKCLFENKFKNKRAEDLRLEDWRDLAVLLT